MSENHPLASLDQAPSHPQSPRRFVVGLGPLLSAIALSGIFFTVYGYGMSIGIAHALQLDPGLLQTTPFDYITLAWIGFIETFNKLEHAKQAFLNFLYDYEYWLLLMFGIVVLSMYGYFRFEREIKRKVLQLKLFIKNDFHATKTETRFQALVFGSFLATFPVVYVFLWLCAGFVAFFLVGVVPIWGYNAGEEYIKDNILPAKLCTSINTAAPKSSSHSSDIHCVKVTTFDGEEIARGGVILSNSELLLLYVPNKGVMRVSIKDQALKIEQVEAFDKPVIKKSK